MTQPEPLYRLTRSKRKTIGIYIRDAEVEVRAPHSAPIKIIEDFVHSRYDWINKQLAEQQQKKEEALKVQHDEEILFLGKTRKLMIYPGTRRIVENDDSILIQTPNVHTAQKQLENWLKKEAMLYLDERVMELAEQTGQRLKITGIQYRKTRSKWGHCTSAGKLQFNWLIIMAPVDVIDYLIIHELCHLTHMNHSKAFWALVESHCADYKVHRQWLHDNGHRIWL